MNWILTLLRILQARKMTTETEKPDEGAAPSCTPPPTCTPPEPTEKFGLLDDLLFMLFLIPMVGVFIPQLRDNIKAGFDILDTLPNWFTFVIVLGVVCIFGLRKQLTDILSNFTSFGKK
jgi:hypothetical protein